MAPHCAPPPPHPLFLGWGWGSWTWRGGGCSAHPSRLWGVGGGMGGAAAVSCYGLGVRVPRWGAAGPPHVISVRGETLTADTKAVPVAKPPSRTVRHRVPPLLRRPGPGRDPDAVCCFAAAPSGGGTDGQTDGWRRGAYVGATGKLRHGGGWGGGGEAGEGGGGVVGAQVPPCPNGAQISIPDVPTLTPPLRPHWGCAVGKLRHGGGGAHSHGGEAEARGGDATRGRPDGPTLTPLLPPPVPPQLGRRDPAPPAPPRASAAVRVAAAAVGGRGGSG